MLYETLLRNLIKELNLSIFSLNWRQCSRKNFWRHTLCVHQKQHSAFARSAKSAALFHYFFGSIIILLFSCMTTRVIHIHVVTRDLVIRNIVKSTQYVGDNNANRGENGRRRGWSVRSVRYVSLEFLDNSCDNVQIPFDPESYRLAADFQLTKFGDPRRNSLQLERRERQLLLDLFHGKEVVFLVRYKTELKVQKWSRL